MKMEGLANVNINALATGSLSANKITTQGHLNLKTTNALPVTGSTRNVYNDKYFDSL
mgnify:CR=1 FL=1